MELFLLFLVLFLFFQTMKKAILTQSVCFFIILLSCLAIGFGSWLETNNLVHSSSPATSQHLSIFKVTMASGSDIVYLTFGLWRYCAYDVQQGTNKCSGIRMNFDIGNFFLQTSYMLLITSYC